MFLAGILDLYPRGLGSIPSGASIHLASSFVMNEMHVVLGTIVLLLALALVGIAIVTGPILRYLDIRRTSRRAFSALMISLAAYLAWVASLFYGDHLGPLNYTPELAVLRIAALVCAVWFFFGALRCSRRLAKAHDTGEHIIREPQR